ncbi:MAG TPA: hypothetical protein VK539_37445 [Myxococcaceae bacterium]|nr:hypothetical protein [Myxococcaceae bacterium]
MTQRGIDARRNEFRRRTQTLISLLLLASLAGCATQDMSGRRSTLHDRRGVSGFSQDSGSGGRGCWTKADDFERLQEAAGLEEKDWHEAGEELEEGDVRALREVLLRTKITLGNFAPRRALFFLLGQVSAQKEELLYPRLLERVRALRLLVVMRPDGYLARALDGEPLQRMGRLEVREGRLMAGRFEVGTFYWNKAGVFYTVDGSLSRPGIMMGELGLERDWASAALDGAEDALLEIAQALGQLISSPVRSVQGLTQLPSAVAALIASSPEYFARYSAMPLQEQLREAARLSTHLLTLYGGAAGTATRLGTAGTRLPVLSLTAEGALALEQVAVPVGATAAALGTGAGAVYVLTTSGSGPGDANPGKAAGSGFKSFTEGNFRENLARLTGKLPEDAHAHHVFPKALAEEFQQLGININDPRFGAWWNKSSHLKMAYEYTLQWREALSLHPTREQVFQRGRELANKYGFQVNY